MSEPVLSPGALNRALLARQALLRREAVPVDTMVERLVGLQAQAPTPPYYGLWSRLEGFDPDVLGRMLTRRDVVRLSLMRYTVHLVTVRDALWLRPLVQAVLERGHQGSFGRRMGGADPAALAAAVPGLLAEGPLTARELGQRLVALGIGEDVEAVGNATRVYAPLVQVPPRGVWGAGGQARYATLPAWTGRSLADEPSRAELVLRYLRGFGPASVMDVQNWSGLTRLREVVDGLRPRLLAFRDQSGRELFDLPDAPRPDAGTPAPVRLLGEFDNVLLGHADRSHIIPAGFPWTAMLAPERSRPLANMGLVEGRLRCTWIVEREGRRRASLLLRPFGALSAGEGAAVEAEARRMLDFAAPDATGREVVLLEPVA